MLKARVKSIYEKNKLKIIISKRAARPVGIDVLGVNVADAGHKPVGLLLEQLELVHHGVVGLPSSIVADQLYNVSYIFWPNSSNTHNDS